MNKLSGKNLAAALLAFFLLTGCSTASKVDTASIEWKGFYYEHVIPGGGAFPTGDMLSEAPTFKSIADCLQWGHKLLKNNPEAGFECAYECDFYQESQTMVCTDTTKVQQ